MQLDASVSPPANIMTFRPGLTFLTGYQKNQHLTGCGFFSDMFFSPVDVFSSDFFSSQTDGWTDRRKVAHKSNKGQNAKVARFTLLYYQNFFRV